MFSERVKSIILSLLILSSLLMTGQIWFNKKLWPDGYDFFVIYENTLLGKIFGTSDNEENMQSRDKIVLPIKMVASTISDFDNVSYVLTENKEEFNTAFGYVREVLTAVFNKDFKNVITTNEEEWQQNININGIYIDFGITYNTLTFADFIDAGNTKLVANINEVREFVIAPGDSVTNDVVLFIKDAKTGSIYKFYSGVSKNELTGLLQRLAGKATKDNNFSFSLRADKPTGIAGEVLFDPYMLLNQRTQQTTDVISKNPLLRGSGEHIEFNNAIIEKILNAFQINSNTVKKHMDANSTLVYVDDRATLKISRQGIIEYKSMAGARGLQLSTAKDVNNSVVKSARLGADFMDKVMRACNGSAQGIRLASFAKNQSSIKLGFDYTHEGLPVKLENNGFCVEIEMEGGYLKSYIHYIRSYEVTSVVANNVSTYAAADLLYNYLPNRQDAFLIKDMYLAYVDDMNEGEKKAQWVAKVNGLDGFITGFDTVK